MSFYVRQHNNRTRMNTRDQLNSIRRRGLLMIFSGWSLSAILIVASDKLPSLAPLICIGVAIVSIAILYMIFAGRCPKCGRFLGGIVTRSYPNNSPFIIPAEVKGCSCCGRSFDAPIVTHQPEIEEPNKTLHLTARSRPVDMILRNYNINPAFDARPRS